MEDLAGDTEKIELSIYKGEGEEHYLFVTTEFNNVRDKKEWTDNGFDMNKLYHYFREAL